MSVPWRSIFETDGPVEVEIGPGTGTFFLHAARRSPHVNFFGIERSHSRGAALARVVTAQGWRNARVLTADAACVIEHLVPTASVRAYHLYFPDPWWKRRHHRRRLLTDAVAAALARTLVPGGRLHLATDVPGVFERALRTLDTVPAFVRVAGIPSPRTIATVFERKGLHRGARIHEATFENAGMAHWSRAVQVSRAAPMTPAESPS
jgi:tRNA (guanine-N7-)-methyltransferase